MAEVRRFYAWIFHSISAALLPDPFLKICSAPELIFFFKKKNLHRKWFLKGGSALEVAFKKLFRYESEF